MLKDNIVHNKRWCSSWIVVTQQLRSSEQQGKKDQWLSLNSGPTLYHGVSSTRATDPGRDLSSPIALTATEIEVSTSTSGLRISWNMLVAVEPATTHCTQYQPQGPVLKGNWGQRISTGIGSWNSTIERRYQVRAQSLVLFPLLPCPSELWSCNYSWTTPTWSDQWSGSVACVAESPQWV